MFERWLHYYWSDDASDAVTLPDTLFVNAVGEVRSAFCNKVDFERVTLADGKPYLSLPHTPDRYFSIARLMLSSYYGPPPPGHCRIGYRDCDVTNVKIENLYWCGDERPVRGVSEQVDYEEGLRTGAEILWRSDHREFSGEFLTGVNHVLQPHLQSKKD